MGGRSVWNPFVTGAATLFTFIEHPSNIEAADHLGVMEDLIDIGAAALSAFIQDPFDIGAAALLGFI